MIKKQEPLKIGDYSVIDLSTLLSYLPSPQAEAIERASVIKPESRTSQISGTYGHFSPGFNSGMYDKTLPMPFQQHVKGHEQLHANGVIDGSPQGEYWADAIQAERNARPEYIRGPFYRPPIRR
jgi:hypothetical protein